MQYSVLCAASRMPAWLLSPTVIQWDAFITDTFGEHSFGRYTEVAVVEGLFCVIWHGPCVPGHYIAVGCSSGVAVKRGSTVAYNIIRGGIVY